MKWLLGILKSVAEAAISAIFKESKKKREAKAAGDADSAKAVDEFMGDIDDGE